MAMKPVQHFTVEFSRIQTFTGSIQIAATSAEDAREQAEELLLEDSPEILWEDSHFEETFQVEGVLCS